MNYSIKIFLAFALFGCLLNPPDYYIQLVRMGTFIIGGFLAYRSFHNKRNSSAGFYFFIMLLFQPFLNIVLHQNVWKIVYVGLAIFLVISLLWNPTTSSTKEN